MSAKSIGLDDALHDYLVSTTVRETDVQKALRERTQTMEMSNMQISAEQGQFMGLLARIVGATRTLEIGTFTGYSALSIAGVLPEDGRVVCIDKSEEWTDIARDYWQRAGLDEKIELRLGDATEVTEHLLDEHGAGSFDFAFIDADKVNYELYYERCLELVRRGGLVTVDNTLWGGSVADENDQDDSTVAIRELNRKIADDDRVVSSLVPIGDGLTVASKL